MKSTTEVLDEYFNENFESYCSRFALYRLKSIIPNAMVAYAQQAIEEDRQNIAENIEFQYGEMDIEGITHREIVDVDYTSILDAPKLELK